MEDAAALVAGSDGSVWLPSEDYLTGSNIAELMRRMGVETYDSLLETAAAEPGRFWDVSLDQLGIAFERPSKEFADLADGKEWPRFFPGARFNFAAECMRSPEFGKGGAELALIWEDEAGNSKQFSYDALADETRRFAAGLVGLGIERGDRVGLLLPNIPEAVFAFLAVGYIGAVAVPLYSGFGPEAASSRLQDAGAKALVCADGFLRRGKPVMLTATAESLMEQVPTLESLVLVDVLGSPPPSCQHVRWKDVIAQNDGTIAPVDTAALDPCIIMYTSGTTGKPKGAVHVHAGFPLRVAQDAAYHFDFRQGDRLFWMSDMGWMVGPYSIISPLMLKGALVLYDGAPDQPDYGRLRAISGRHGVTHFGTSPSAIRAFAANEDAALAPAADQLRVLITAGEIIDFDAFEWYYKRFGQGRLPIINYTGGTEVSGAILSNSVMRPIRPGGFNSIGIGMSAGIVDPSGNRVKGVPGELAIFEPFVGMTMGFWRTPERYIESYWSKVPGIWMHGDLAIEDEDGHFTLLGRCDDVMKIAGKRIGPSEIEAIVADGKDIIEAVAFGVPDALSGEAIVIMLVVNPASQEGAEARAAKIVTERLGKAFRPKALAVVPRLPKTRNGKVVRRLARAAWLGEAPGNVDGLEDPGVFEELKAISAARQAQ
ncbi:AMP-binding protein [Rhizorhapis sp. SPR117]|uniref:AMP-binding protein n=1 Tax=Rhizorhapis sp. SPR117 TaxID=2912611 RepID=UPI001F26B465|nr:AMP-binding protein [Rhizorhapis sp. SPR117]